MFQLFRLAGVSAVLAAAFVLATGERSTQASYELRPGLIVTIE